MILNEKSIELKYKRYKNRLEGKVRKTKFVTSKVFVYLFLILWLIICLFPFFWAILASFNKYTELSSIGINPIPKKATLENYNFIFTNSLTSSYIKTWFINSIIYSTISAFLNVFFNMLAGYALARISFRGKRLVFWYLLAGTMIPAQVTQIPQIILLIQMKVIGSDVSNSTFFAGIIFTSMTSSTWIFMARQFYINHSVSVEEAARVDGLSVFSMFIRISLRQMVPLMATMFTMVFMAAWNNFIMFVLWSGGDPERMTLVSGLQVVGDSAFSIAPQFSRIVTLAATNLVVIPIILIYFASLWFQKKAAVEGEK